MSQNNGMSNVVNSFVKRVVNSVVKHVVKSVANNVVKMMRKLLRTMCKYCGGTAAWMGRNKCRERLVNKFGV